MHQMNSFAKGLQGAAVLVSCAKAAFWGNYCFLEVKFDLLRGQYCTCWYPVLTSLVHGRLTVYKKAHRLLTNNMIIRQSVFVYFLEDRSLLVLRFSFSFSFLFCFLSIPSFR